MLPQGLLDFLVRIRPQIGCFIILIYISRCYFMVKRKKTVSHRIFSITLITALINDIFDIITVFCVNELDIVPKWFNKFAHIVFLFTIFLTLYLSYSYISNLLNGTNPKRSKLFKIAPVVLSFLGIAFLPMWFVEDKNCNYSSGPAVWLCYAGAAIYFVVSVILVARKGKLLNQKARLAIFTSLLTIFGVTVIQFLGVLMTCIGVTLICVTFFYTVESPDAVLIETLEYERERANEANRAKTQFLSNMSHEIRTPINAVLGMNEMIMRECEDENILSYSANIKTAGNTLLALINEILDFSKIEEGKLEIIPVDYDLNEVINDLVNMIKPRAEAKQLRLVIDVDESVPSRLHGDEIRLKQIITNILTNAVKYTRIGTVTFMVSFKNISDDRNSVMLDVSVADTGIGIKKEDIPKLFDEFERIEEKRNRNIEGTGLGINITQKLLTMMESTLKVESEYSKGSTFSFSVKQGVVDRTPIGKFKPVIKRAISEHSKASGKFTASKALILVTDDTPMNLTVFKNLLKKTKINIDMAVSGDECIKMSLEKKYDIIFLDHMMPHKDGIETLKEMQTHTESPNAKTPIVCLTANAIAGARETYMEAGFTDYITKPIDPEVLENMIVKYLSPDKYTLVKNKGPVLKSSNMVSDEMREQAAAYERGETKAQPPAQDSGAAAVGADISEQRVRHNEPIPMNDEDEDVIIPEFLYSIRDLNIADGISHCGSESSFLETLTTFAETSGKIADDTEGFWKVFDIKNTTVKVHAMKSMLRIIGVAPLSSFAERLEKAGNENDIKMLETYIPELLAGYRQLSADLQPLLSLGAEQDELPEADIDMLHEMYRDIDKFAKNFDYDSIDEALAKLKNYKIPEGEEAVYKKLKEVVENFDYDMVSDVLSEKI